MISDKLIWRYGLSTHRGTIKDVNEDNAYMNIIKDANGNDFVLITIADGMGGYQAGDIASQTVIDNVRLWEEDRIEALLNKVDPLNSIEKDLKKLLYRTNKELIELGESTNRKLGTTATIQILYKNYFLICHVGDSRVYQLFESSNDETENLNLMNEDTQPLVARRTIAQLTVDHSWVEEQVRKGLLTKKQATKHPKRNVLLECLGIKNKINPLVLSGVFKDEDIFLICSDGFYNMFSDYEILSMIMSSNLENLQSITETLVQRANDLGATDNITVLLIQSLPSFKKEEKLLSKITNYFKVFLERSG